MTGNPDDIYLMGPRMSYLHGITSPSNSIVPEIPGNLFLKHHPVQL